MSSLIGFEDEELARLLAAQDATEGLTDEDAVPELPQTPVSADRRSLDPRRAQAAGRRRDEPGRLSRS